ncbi:MAG TPA: hypothetical protein VH302_05175 [Bryobacteraceae bacterium]|nr:hypothetical protein [Bryobacteraceae bacterium]
MKIGIIGAGNIGGTLTRRLGRPVIKAFKNIHAQSLMQLGRPAVSRDRIALPVAEDDAAAKQVMMKLVDDLGFDPVDAGTLDDSWRQQPGTPVYLTNHNARTIRDALAQASPNRPAPFRAKKK